MIEEKFAQGSSFLHERDPRAKILSAICITVTVALTRSFTALIPALFLVVLLALLSRLSHISLLKRLLIVNSFTFFIWVTLPLTFGGEQIHLWGTLPLSMDGIIMAGLITMKTNIIILAIITLLATSTIADLGHAFEKLYVPRRLCFILLYSYRYVFVIFQEYRRLLRAAKMRSFSPKTNIHTYRTFAYLFGMTLVKSHNRSSRVYQAMLLRGFSGKLPSLRQYSISNGDFWLSGLCFSCSCCIVALSLLH